ncbi:MAG TPA: hypothetical protein VFO55_10965 [Gemmatimonadaceae bacterium]|nr:hypothetical protein [Gemmatimonadaceae bacterium]
MRSTAAYEKSYDVIAADAAKSITGVSARVRARALSPRLSPADQASFANRVAFAPKVVEESAEPRENDGATVSAFAPAPVTSVALPALIASDAAVCAAQGMAHSNNALDHRKYANLPT